ncbi:hypothetical protein Cni_G26054 [Canna indica]|uniref:Methyltransferase-like protein 23 n=1 Tax=Canna indica TaxID=4628 RepID=A0AAQ3QQY8_9LILI|nr:hypothetical protein Cni_G26054 [Canna indica]
MGSGSSSDGEDSREEVDKEVEEEEEDDDDAADSPGPPSSPSPHRNMTTISRHYFGGDSSADDHAFFNIREDYGMFVWPCCIVLAEYIWQQRSRFSGVSVVELGAGTSLPGLVAAKVGANVTLTDNSKKTEVLQNIKRICDLNTLYCEIIGLTWGEWDEPIFDLCPQIVLGADVLYDSTDFDHLFATVAFLLESCPGSVFITTYQSRSGHHLIEFLMVKWGLKCSELLDGYSFMPPNKACRLQGNIQLVELVLDNQKNFHVRRTPLPSATWQHLHHPSHPTVTTSSTYPLALDIAATTISSSRSPRGGGGGGGGGDV